MNTRFSLKADSYEQNAIVQKLSAEQLIKALKSKSKNPTLAADLGCGTGFLTKLLFSQFPNIQIDACDISEGMLEEVSKLDYQELNLHNSSQPPQDQYDLIVANFSFQWFPSIEDTIKGCYEKLSANGVLAFSIPVVGTFKKLNQVINEQNLSITLPTLPKAQTILDIANKFAETEVKAFQLEETFSSTLEFLRGLHNIGAVREGQQTSRKDLKRLITLHDQLFEQDIISNYEVLQVLITRTTNA